MKQVAVFTVVLLAFFFAGAPCGAAQKKAAQGWTDAEMAAAAEGCTKEMVASNLETYKKKGAAKGVKVSAEELEVVRRFMGGMFSGYCRCVFTELNRLYGKKGVPIASLRKEHPDAVKNVMAKAQCKVPMPDEKQVKAMQKEIAALRAKKPAK